MEEGEGRRCDGAFDRRSIRGKWKAGVIVLVYVRTPCRCHQ